MSRTAFRRVRPLLAVMLVALPAPVAAQQGVTAAPPPARHTAADVAFMQGMIGHHAQALVMCTLVTDRASHPQVAVLAERIAVSQQDEIGIMRRWLEERGLSAPDGHGEHLPHAHAMPGMLSPAQMDTLSRARGASFDRLFLQYMIQHHEGALVMVAQLLATANAARDPMLFQFASDVDTDQRAEIRRMRALLTTL
ncbi:DUF305 domain-containing protein [Gemmatimonas sp.]|uniref:DUF305 domain-containing protein n=1 Tax=Gemmatimonas sp. TaxID=1962908 RepID=UPI0037BE5CEA